MGKEETNGHDMKGDVVAENGDIAENGNAESRSDEAKAENDEPKGENNEPKAENNEPKAENCESKVENGHSDDSVKEHTESEATKRKADDAGDAALEPIPVSAEKIAKLSVTEEKVEEKAEVTA